jgi:hypothetical protein
MSTREPRADRNKRIAIEAITLLERAANDDGLRIQDELAAFRARWDHVPWVHPPTVSGFDLDLWVTAEEMAKHADVKPNTVRRWNYRGYITSVTIGGRLHYNIGEVVAYQNRRTTDS